MEQHQNTSTSLGREIQTTMAPRLSPPLQPPSLSTGNGATYGRRAVGRDAWTLPRLAPRLRPETETPSVVDSHHTTASLAPQQQARRTTIECLSLSSSSSSASSSSSDSSSESDGSTKKVWRSTKRAAKITPLRAAPALVRHRTRTNRTNCRTNKPNCRASLLSKTTYQSSQQLQNHSEQMFAATRHPLSECMNMSDSALDIADDTIKSTDTPPNGETNPSTDDSSAMDSGDETDDEDENRTSMLDAIVRRKRTFPGTTFRNEVLEDDTHDEVLDESHSRLVSLFTGENTAMECIAETEGSSIAGDPLHVLQRASRSRLCLMKTSSGNQPPSLDNNDQLVEHTRDDEDEMNETKGTVQVAVARAKVTYGAHRTLLYRQDELIETYSSRVREMKRQGLNSSGSSSSDDYSDDEDSKSENLSLELGSKHSTDSLTPFDQVAEINNNSQVRDTFQPQRVKVKGRTVNYKVPKRVSKSVDHQKKIRRKDQNVRSVHELRQVSSSRQQVEEIEYLLAGLLDSSSNDVKRVSWIGVIREILSTLVPVQRSLKDVAVQHYPRDRPTIVGYKRCDSTSRAQSMRTKQIRGSSSSFLDVIRLQGYSQKFWTAVKTSLDECEEKRSCFDIYVLALFTALLLLRNEKNFEAIALDGIGELNWLDDSMFDDCDWNSNSLKQFKELLKQYSVELMVPVEFYDVPYGAVPERLAGKYSDEFAHYVNPDAFSTRDICLWMIDQFRSFGDPKLTKMSKNLYSSEAILKLLAPLENCEMVDSVTIRGFEYLWEELSTNQTSITRGFCGKDPKFFMELMKRDGRLASDFVKASRNSLSYKELAPSFATMSILITMSNTPLNADIYIHELEKAIESDDNPYKEVVGSFFTRLVNIATRPIVPESTESQNVESAEHMVSHVDCADSDFAASSMLGIAFLVNTLTASSKPVMQEMLVGLGLVEKLTKVVSDHIEEPSLVTVHQLMLLGLLGWPEQLSAVRDKACKVLESFLTVGERVSLELGDRDTNMERTVSEVSQANNEVADQGAWNVVLKDVRDIFRKVLNQLSTQDCR